MKERPPANAPRPLLQCTILLLAASLLGTGCGVRPEGEYPPDGEELGAAEDTPSRIDAVRGDHQSGLPGQVLGEPLVVRVLGQRSRDFFGRRGLRHPVRRVAVTFQLENIPGSRSASGPRDPRSSAYPVLLDPVTERPGEGLHFLTVTTDDSGLARVRIQLGTENGDWRIEASVSRGPKKKPLKEHFRVLSGVEKLSGDAETIVGEDVPLALRLVKQTKDGELAPLAGRVVYFRVVGEPAGRGEKASINNRKDTTDADGIRDGSSLSVGDRPGTYHVLAEVEPQEGDTPIRGIVFTVKATAWYLLILEILAGALLFLLGVRILANGFLIVLSPKIHLATGPLAGNRFLGYFGGVLAGLTFQSSSSVTSHLENFANGGLLSARGATGLLLGSALGATALPQALSLQLGFLIAPLFALSLVFFLMPRRSGRTHWSGVFLGAGLVLASWSLLSSGLDLLALSDRFREDVLPAQVSYAAGFGAVLRSVTIYLAIGLALGLILRTSNLIVILAILLAAQEIITPATGIPLIVGANLGAALHSFLRASVKAREAWRIGTFALVQNLFGLVLFGGLSLVVIDGTSPILRLVEWATPGTLFHPLPEKVEHHLAMAHTLYNFSTGIVFLLLPRALYWLSDRIVPARKATDDLKPHRLDEDLIPVPSLALRQCVEEVAYLTDLCKRSVAEGFDSFRYADLGLAEQVVRRQEVIAGIHRETSRYLLMVAENQLSRHDASRAEALQSAAGSLSRIGECAEALRELAARRVEDKVEGTDEVDRDLGEVYDLVMAQFENLLVLLRRRDTRVEESAVKTVERLAKFHSRFEAQWRQRIEQAGGGQQAGVSVHVDALVYQQAFNVLLQVASHLGHVAERMRLLTPERL